MPTEWDKVLIMVLRPAVVVFPYILLGWLARLADDDSNSTFWIVVALLLLLRGVFALTEFIADAIKWNFWSKKMVTEFGAKFLETHNFPDPSKMHYPAGYYGLLEAIANRYEYDEKLRLVAKKEIEKWNESSAWLTQRQRDRVEAALWASVTVFWSRRWKGKPYKG